MDRGSRKRVRMDLVPEEYRTPRQGDPGEVRWGRVNAARARIAAGHYHRDGVSERLTVALLEELTDS